MLFDIVHNETKHVNRFLEMFSHKYYLGMAVGCWYIKLKWNLRTKVVDLMTIYQVHFFSIYQQLIGV